MENQREKNLEHEMETGSTHLSRIRVHMPANLILGTSATSSECSAGFGRARTYLLRTWACRDFSEKPAATARRRQLMSSDSSGHCYI